MRHLQIGALAPQEPLHAIDGTTISLPDPNQILHLHFSRFADCPICNLHIADLRRRAADYQAAGIRQLAVFHSPAEHVREYRPDMPFDLIADPDREIYARFGVGTSRRALLHPRAIRRLIAEARTGNRAQEAHGGIHGVPADFLIGPDGRLLLVHYGRHADDVVAVQQILDAVAAVAVAVGRPSTIP
jgi:peroxiredoxin